MQNKWIKNSLVVVFSAVLVFQFLILFSVIPYDITWGGRLKSYEDMLVFVSIAILINALFLFVLLIKAGYVKTKVSNAFINAVLWTMVIVFALNTVGNLFAISPLERYVATPITLILSVLSYKILKDK